MKTKFSAYKKEIQNSNKLIWLGMSLILFVTLSVERIRLFYTAGWPDPFIYLGYAQNYAGLLEKWGPTYFASRIPAIVPLYFREKIGLDFQVYRYIILLCLATGVFLLLNNQKIQVRLLVPVIVVNNVWILRHVSDDYVVGLTSVYVLFSFLLGLKYTKENRHGNLQIIGIGSLVGLAIVSNISIILLLAPWFLSLVYLRRKQINLLKTILLAFFGCFGTICALGLFMYSRLGIDGVKSFKSQIDMIFILRGEVGELFTAPLVLFAPMLLLFFTVAIGAWNLREDQPNQSLQMNQTPKITMKKKEDLSTGTICFASTVVFGLIYHQYSPTNWLSGNFYIAFFIPAFLVVFALSISKLDSAIKLTMILILQILLIYGLTSLRVGDFENYVSSFFRLGLVGILILFLIFGFVRRRPGKEIPVFLMILAATISPLVTDNSGKFLNLNNEASWSEYRDFVQSSSSTHQEDVWKIARANNNFLSNHVPRGDVLFTIYPKDPSWLVSIDSGQLYGYSCFECTDIRGYQTIRKYPPFSKSQIETLATRNFIEVMSSSKFVNSEIVESILASDPRWQVFKTIDSSTTSKFYGVLLKKFNE